jgi:putative membrane protein
MESVLLSSLRGVDNFLAYLATSVALLVVFVWIYIHITPYREIALIREGNPAAAASLSGAVLGFVIPLASAVAHSVAFVDMLLWGAIALVIQLAAFGVARILFPTIAADIPAGRVALGVFVGALAVAVGILNAACMSY